MIRTGRMRPGPQTKKDHGHGRTLGAVDRPRRRGLANRDQIAERALGRQGQLLERGQAVGDAGKDRDGIAVLEVIGRVELDSRVKVSCGSNGCTVGAWAPRWV